MKKITLLILFCISISSLFAQDTTRILSKLEKLQKQSGTIIKREEFPKGKIRNTKISLVVVTDLKSKKNSRPFK